jgi:hypothetical protein
VTISKAQLAKARIESYDHGNLDGRNQMRAQMQGEITQQKLARLEDALIALSKIAHANAEIASAIAQTVTLVNR